MRNALFDHNQFGILTGYDPSATILVDGTEFSHVYILYNRISAEDGTDS